MTWRRAASACYALRPRPGSKTHVLTEDKIRLLERHSPEFRIRHVETSGPGELLNQDTFYWGTLKGVGRIYVQVVIDAWLFENLDQVRDKTHEWLTRYNETWPHDSLGDASPIEYTRNAGFSTFELST